jgi:hypothetical protein
MCIRGRGLACMLVKYNVDSVRYERHKIQRVEARAVKVGKVAQELSP